MLDTKILSVKLTMILALTAALRENEIKKLDIQYMVKVDSEFTFSIAGQQKQVKQGNRVLEITFHIFPEENSLCPYKTLEYYLEVTEP